MGYTQIENLRVFKLLRFPVAEQTATNPLPQEILKRSPERLANTV